MSIDWEHGTPVKWSEYLSDPGLGEHARRALEALHGPDVPAMPAKQLGLGAEVVPPAIVSLGVDEARTLLLPAVPLALVAVDQLRTLFPASPSKHGVGFIAFVNGMECSNVPLPGPMAGAPAPEWLGLLAARPRQLADHQRVGVALACLAFGLRESVPGVLGGKPSRQYEPGWQFYDRWRELAEYLALAQGKGASAEDVRPAFESVVWAFPTLVKQQQAWWRDLLLAARVYYGLFEHRPVTEVGQALHDLVRTMA
jgi:hypothetical protein